MSDILTPSEHEIDRLFQAFSKITAMHNRMKVLDLAERLAKESPRKLVSRSLLVSKVVPLKRYPA